MEYKKLREKVEHLKTSMDVIDKTDEKSRNALSQMIEQIQLKLKDKSDAAIHMETLDQLGKNVEYFETKHPEITKILNEVSIILSHLGV